MCEEDATHNVPRELQAKLAEAKKWYDRRQSLEEMCGHASGPGSAQRNQEDRDASDRLGGWILEEVVELCEGIWGFGPELEEPK